jgi:hypothetical protein
VTDLRGSTRQSRGCFGQGRRHTPAAAGAATASRDDAPDRSDVPAPLPFDDGSCLLDGAEGSAATRKVVGFTRRPPQTLSRAASWESVNNGKATTRASRLMPICRYFDGASRTRTGDLLGAIRACAVLESSRYAAVSSATRPIQGSQNVQGLAAITESLPPKPALRGQIPALRRRCHRPSPVVLPDDRGVCSARWSPVVLALPPRWQLDRIRQHVLVIDRVTTSASGSAAGSSPSCFMVHISWWGLHGTYFPLHLSLCGT